MRFAVTHVLRDLTRAETRRRSRSIPRRPGRGRRTRGASGMIHARDHERAAIIADDVGVCCRVRFRTHVSVPSVNRRSERMRVCISGKLIRTCHVATRSFSLAETLRDSIGAQDTGNKEYGSLFTYSRLTGSRHLASVGEASVSRLLIQTQSRKRQTFSRIIGRYGFITNASRAKL